MNANAMGMVLFSHALWGCALSRGPKAEFSANLYDLLQQGGEPHANDDAYVEAVKQLFFAIRDGKVDDPISFPLMQSATIDDEGLPGFDSLDEKWFEENADAIFNRFYTAQETYSPQK